VSTHDPKPEDNGRAVTPSDKLGDLAAGAGIRRIHILAWRDLADVEAGGSELHASSVAAKWAEAGLEVLMRTSYAQGAPPETVRDGYSVVRRGGRYMIFPRAAASEMAGRRGRRDALVEIWNGVPFFSPIWARGPRATWLHHVHEDMWPMVLPPRLARAGQVLERNVAPPFYRWSPIVTLSDSSRRHIVDRMKIPAERIRVVPPGISERYSPGGDESPEPTVLAVGRLMPAKDFPAMIRAMNVVRQDQPRARLIVVGEGYERLRLEQISQDLDAEQWCDLRGRVGPDELLSLYRSAWLVASASRAEGWGMTLTEAAACATPAVATRIPGHVDAVRDQVTGVLVDSDDELASAIGGLLRNHDQRRKMGQAAREFASSLTWDRTAYDTLEVLASQRRR